jgi:hypothetical protein
MTDERASTTTAAATAAKAAEQAMARLADLARTTLQSQASLAKQSIDLARGTMSGDLDRTSAGKAYVEAVSREGARYWRTVGELGIDYATDLVALGKSVSTTVLHEMAAAGRKPGKRHTSGAWAGAADSTRHHVMPEGGGLQTTSSRSGDEASSGVPDQDAGGRRVKVRLRGPVGGRAEGTVTVANQHPRPRRILLNAGDVVDSSGALVGAGLDVSPTTVTVPSGKERPVTIGVDLDAASFSAGEQYSCAVEVSGGDEATIEDVRA